MKLYTEETIRFIAKAIYDHDFDHAKTPEELVNELTPIELPSDEDIDKKAFQVPYDGTDIFYDKSFIKGAKSVIEQILNQNKQTK